ncbi:hypothetical protein LCR01_06140 [Companilactobacillus crustorum]|uniref:Uncharacterized protein n=3 Tax=Companilactobacillus TaxID=2767879 RepID=A0A837RJ21_9LACO|nr:hypothetical protein [Companilactobacillus crustorum]HCD08632.1 hypothetical protein [Lactobacillus sp.]APU71329.1 hypothetical protein BI355_1010 [Companilactobacillus crustorum]KRK43743.1 hypothetical protein FD26_GL001619 [Companilactobacillus crustorum JCM 15951]KRO21201.1 hypothetical protein IV63_GL001929 [Companilactobacillus crustorum]WDT66637.1 hypothetical protein NV391_05380 [Companilactobacillus crustorum]
MENKLEKLTYDQVVAIHLAIEDSEEITFSEKRLQSNIEFLNQFDQVNIYLTHLFCTIICDDIFAKYNTETAIAAMDFFLRRNGYCLDLANQEEHDTIMGLVQTIKETRELKKTEINYIQSRLADCIHPYDGAVED